MEWIGAGSELAQVAVSEHIMRRREGAGTDSRENRLIRTKARYDPTIFFALFSQSIANARVES